MKENIKTSEAKTQAREIAEEMKNVYEEKEKAGAKKGFFVGAIYVLLVSFCIFGVGIYSLNSMWPVGEITLENVNFVVSNAVYEGVTGIIAIFAGFAAFIGSIYMFRKDFKYQLKEQTKEGIKELSEESGVKL